VKTQDQHVYFPGLDGLRFLAVSLIIIPHIEQVKAVFGLKNFLNNPFMAYIGDLGISFFFVLSGFLITYLLFSEKNNFGDISIRNFYARRALRIWPLYYLIVGLGLFIIPAFGFLNMPHLSDKIYSDFGIKVFLFAFILPNVAINMFPPVPFVAHTWAVGVEQQFYIIWPVIIKFSRKYLLIFALIFFLVSGISNLLFYASAHLKEAIVSNSLRGFIDFLAKYSSFLRISSMAIGGMGAYLLFFKKEKITRIIYRKDLQLLTLLATVVFLYNGARLNYFRHELYSLLSGIVILNISANAGALIKLENKLFSFLGRISYGLYMYHVLAIVISLVVAKRIFKNDLSGFIFNLFLYSSTILITIIIAYFSYYLFERRFLTRKKLFSRIISGYSSPYSSKPS